MFILTQDKTQIFNMDKMESIYIRNDTAGNCIRFSVIGETTRAGELGRYESFTKAKGAMERIKSQILSGQSNIVIMPSDE